MASHFDRWEKDPFFSAAEEVQESADRMESTYRTWIHAMKDTSGSWNCDELRRDLRTTLGTAKWQLEEFEKAVSSSYNNFSADDAKDRHHEFVIAISSQIKKVENSLNESAVSQGKPPLPWLRLDEGERDELAAFLSGPSTSSADLTSAKVNETEQPAQWKESVKQSMLECSKNSFHSRDKVQSEAKDEKFPGHRRTASASADIGAWKIAVVDDTSTKQPALPPPRKIPSFQGLLNTMESATKLKWSKNGYRKLKFSQDGDQEAESILPRTQPLTRGMNTCYERNKSCLDGCDDCYDKQLYGWYGALQRQLQRSQYYVQYSRHVRMVFSVVLLIFLIVSLAARTI